MCTILKQGFKIRDYHSVWNHMEKRESAIYMAIKCGMHDCVCQDNLQTPMNAIITALDTYYQSIWENQ